MIDYLKTNWKTILVGGIVAIVIVCLCCCEGKVEEVPVIEEAPEVTPAVEEPVKELTDEEIEKIF